ncbi:MULTISPECIES: hypothetical protein [Lactobacillus]|uniref:Phage neck terminator protein gp12-like domain-containing protein n=1 Tax=Lactobacillus xujianguonis TaxID=2495899 RepID=A0A437SSW5_9LACO|nr:MULTISPECIES: hypothetical protein [Lactobacillus]RVU70013.1 hypothetical protein EJK17_09770 [Lactobacillus xujianguonis]RVU73456.1 hypothetical protein EJK20_08210 [Lactobacillus xujianguonis]
MALENSSRPKLTKNYLIVFILAKIVDQLFKCPFLPVQNSGRQTKYPFFTYQMIDAHKYSTGDNRPDQFYCRFQLDCHAVDQFEANDMAGDLLDALANRRGFRHWFEQVNVVPQLAEGNRSDIRNHTLLQGINYDNDYGFYFDFLISHADTVYQASDLNFEFDESDIGSIKTQGSVGKHFIDINNIKKEEI